MTDNNVVTLYKKPSPVEIEIEMTDEEVDQIMNEVRRAPANEMMEFLFVLMSENKCVTISAQVNPSTE